MRTRRPSVTSWWRVCRTVMRLTRNCSHSSRSEGTRPSGAQAPESMRSSIAAFNWEWRGRFPFLSSISSSRLSPASVPEEPAGFHGYDHRLRWPTGPVKFSEEKGLTSRKEPVVFVSIAHEVITTDQVRRDSTGGAFKSAVSMQWRLGYERKTMVADGSGPVVRPALGFGPPARPDELRELHRDRRREGR